MAEVCRVCDRGAERFGSATVLGVHRVDYYRCGDCGFIQTEEPYWLGEAYGEAIGTTDVGLVSRNLACADVAQAVTATLVDAGGRFVDYGGGYGMLVRLMRDRGFDFVRQDRYCQNLFARGFDDDGGPVDMITAFEVFEHLPRPREEVGALAARTDHILFSTLLLPDPPPSPGDWWYYALEGGQHVSLYSPAALAALGDRFGMFSASAGQDMHLLTRSRRAARLFPFVARSKVGRLMGRLRRRRSLLEADYARAIDPSSRQVGKAAHGTERFSRPSSSSSPSGSKS